MTDDEDKPILDEEALAAWPAGEPPAGFADRVMAARADRPARRRRVWWIAPVALAAAAAAVFAWPRGAVEKGTVAAGARVETKLGERAVAVAEPGSSLRWSVRPGGDGAVVQDRGDVFYRVERGGPFVVATPAGEVRVLGTCFRVEVTEMKIGKQGIAGAAAGAAVTAVVMVTVYEGRVLLANEKGRTDLRAGERATAATGAAPGPAVTASASAATPAAASAAPAAAATPAELAAREAGHRAEIAKLRARIAELEGGRQTDMFSVEVPPGEQPRYNPHPSHDDLVAMAKECKIAFDLPSTSPDHPFNISAQARTAAGLSESDAAAAVEAANQSMARTLAQIRAVYVEVTGNNAASEELSMNSMISEIEEKAADSGASKWQLAAERAGLVPVPSSLGSRSPTERMLRALSSSGDDVERAIAAVVGADRAQALRAANNGWGSTWSLSGCSTTR